MALARLIIKDEVNVKIEGLDLHERKELSNRAEKLFTMAQAN
jgi:hypothetical protein